MIFEAKLDNKKIPENNADELWVILVRFINESRAINKINLLPHWLNEFVKYDNPKSLPQEFISTCSREQPLEYLRIVLGMSPTKVNFISNMDKLPFTIKQEMMKLPVWYQSRLQQLAFVAHEFGEGAKLEASGVCIKCPATKEKLM